MKANYFILLLLLSFFGAVLSLKIDFQEVMSQKLSSPQSNHLIISEINTIIIIVQSQLILYDLFTMKVTMTIHVEEINHTTIFNYIIAEKPNCLYLVFIENLSKIKYIKLFTAFQDQSNVLSIQLTQTATAEVNSNKSRKISEQKQKFTFFKVLILNIVNFLFLQEVPSNLNQDLFVILEQPPLTISSQSYPSTNQPNILHLIFYHRDQQILERICDLGVIKKGQLFLNCDSQSRDFQMLKPSHFIKATAFKFAILTNNTYLLAVQAQQDNKNLRLINLFNDKLVLTQIGEKQKDACTIEMLGMASNNEQQDILPPNEIPNKENHILIALHRCDKGKVYLMEYDISTATMVQFSEQFQKITKEPKRILNQPSNEPGPLDNKPGMPGPNLDRGPLGDGDGKSKLPDDKDFQFGDKNVENSQMHFSVLPYSNQIVAQLGDQVQTIQLDSTIISKNHKRSFYVIPLEISNLILHFFETSQADTNTRQLPFAIALDSAQMSIFSALCPTPDSIYFSSQQQCMSTSCNQNMSYQYQPKKLKQEICLNYQANTQGQLVIIVLVVFMILLGAAWFVYKKYYQKEDLLGQKEDPRKLLSSNNNNVEIQEYEQKPKDQEPVSIDNCQAIMDPLEKKQSHDIEGQGKKLPAVERQEDQEFSEKKQSQQTVQSSQNDLISQKCLNSSTPTPQFDIESSSASLSPKKSQRHSEFIKNHHHNKSDQKQEYFLQNNSKQNNEDLEQHNHILQSSYYNNQLSYEQSMQVLQEQKQTQFPIPTKAYPNKSTHLFNPFASDQESNVQRNPLVSEDISQNSQSSSDPLLINQYKQQQSYLRLLQCSKLLQQQKQSSEVEDNLFEADQNALKAFEDALNDYIEDRSADFKPQMSIIQQQEQQEIPNNNKENSIENMADDYQNKNDKNSSDNMISDIKLLLSDDAFLLQNGSINPFLLAESIIKRASQREQFFRQSLEQQYQLLQNGSKSQLGSHKESQISEINKNEENSVNYQSNSVKQNRIESGEGKDSKSTQILVNHEGDSINDNENEQQIIIQRNQEAENDQDIKEFESQGLTPQVEIPKNKGKYPNLNKKNEKQQQQQKEEQVQEQKLKTLEATENECPICQVNPKNCTLYKCGHRLCSNCANEIQATAKSKTQSTPPTCPICRTEIQDIVMNFG